MSNEVAQVAETIARQIGRAAMTKLGVNRIICGAKSLVLDIKESPLNISVVAVSLRGDDTYAVTTWANTENGRTTRRSEGVYAENLVAVIFADTGIKL